ncbi:hypothetical protein V1507DRAFT_481986 [Lipomyces tetrasporus]
MDSDQESHRSSDILVTKPIPPVGEDQVLLKTMYLSNDPAQRLLIDANINPARHYSVLVKVGEVITSYASISAVVESKSKNLPVGTVVSAMGGWLEYSVMPAEACLPLKPIGDLPLTHYAGVFGVAGVTAYHGLVDIVQAGPNDAVVVSGAAGAIGSTVVQIAMHMLGCKKVIDIAGTDAKCKWVETLCADVSLNYKSPTFKEDLDKAAEGFVEVLFDNVGGQILDLVLKVMKKNGQNWYDVIAMRLQIRGLVVTDATPARFTEIIGALIKGYQEGKLKAREDGQTIVETTFEDIPKTWMRLWDGRSTGKL